MSITRTKRSARRQRIITNKKRHECLHRPGRRRRPSPAGPTPEHDIALIPVHDPKTGEPTGQNAKVNKKNADLAKFGPWYRDDRGVYAIVQKDVPLKVYLADVVLARRDGTWVHTHTLVKDPHDPKSEPGCFAHSPIYTILTIMGIKVVLYLDHMTAALDTDATVVVGGHTNPLRQS